MATSAFPETPSKRHGFTLIELSIVLVIIGLLVGGILVGRDLISASQARAQISQIDQYQQAVNAFKGKYDCIPGDCYVNALKFGLPAVNNNDGADDGLIYNGWAYFHVDEIFNFWAQLGAAGLAENKLGYPSALTSIQDATTYISDFSKYFPVAKVGIGYAVAVNVTDATMAYSTLGNSFVITGRVSVASVLGYSNTIPPPSARAIDAKVDDGSPATGRVQVFAPNYYAYVNNPNTGYAGCAFGSPIAYLTNTTPTCMLAFKFQ